MRAITRAYCRKQFNEVIHGVSPPEKYWAHGHWRLRMKISREFTTTEDINTTKQCTTKQNIFRRWATVVMTSYSLQADSKKWKKHDDVIKGKHFPRYWPCVPGIHRSLVISPHKGQWHGAFMFSLICAWINRWVNNREAGVWDAIAPIMTSL